MGSMHWRVDGLRKYDIGSGLPSAKMELSPSPMAIFAASVGLSAGGDKQRNSLLAIGLQSNMTAADGCIQIILYNRLPQDTITRSCVTFIWDW
jgi:hypothetical protein